MFGEIARLGKLYAGVCCCVILLAQLDAESRKVKYSQGLGRNQNVVLKWVCDQDSKDLGFVSRVEIERSVVVARQARSSKLQTSHICR